MTDRNKIYIWKTEKHVFVKQNKKKDMINFGVYCYLTPIFILNILCDAGLKTQHYV